MEIIVAFSHNKFPPDLMYLPGTKAYKGAWQATIDAAEAYNDPGRFTAFIGYEWTSNTGGNNLHRNVIFRDNGDKASLTEPFTVYPPLGSDNPRALWKWMAAYEQKTGGSVLAIAHNGNLSNGTMFPIIESFTGKPVDKEYVTERERWERLYETTQTKGTGESHPYLSPNDEFADFELWDKGNLDGSVAKAKEMLQYEYSRAAPPRTASSSSASWASIPTSSGWSAAAMRTPVSPRWKRTTSSARRHRRSRARSV